MEAITIHLSGHRGIERSREPLKVGVPLPKGIVQNTTQLALLFASNEPLQADFSPMLNWPDGSIRWLEVSTVVDITQNSPDKLLLTTLPSDSSIPKSSLKFSWSGNDLTVDTGRLELRLRNDHLDWEISLKDPSFSGMVNSHIPFLTDKNDNTCRPVLTQKWLVAKSRNTSLTLESMGQWVTSSNQTFANFLCRLTCFEESETIEVEMVLHNARRSLHRGGLWDLGDPGSIRIRSHGLTVTTTKSGTPWLQPEEKGEIQESSQECAEIALYQDSSGGKNWNSRNHLDANMNISTRFQGYQVTRSGQQTASGYRARPIAGITGISPVQVGIRQFWENFPGSVNVMPNALTINLLPPETTGLHELQGGERKSRTLWLNYSNDRNALYWTRSQLIPVLAAHQFEKAQAFPWFKADAASGPLESLIQAGVEGTQNFFNKREVIDEYGWRNFGELFADHETLYQPEGERPLISHYNNQYDAVYGFARQFASSGNPRWFMLMDDLARHVVDIDIYHTDKDRSEYNHGLFWHTDHYLDAVTCTHRTFSCHNSTSSTPGQTGGGPGAEHCYTTGLFYHYLLTGNTESRKAVLGLAHWIRNLHEGSGGFLEQVLAIKKNDVPAFKSLIRGEQPTVHRYPFTRGTGNYINALLDAWQLEPEKDWLKHLEIVIQRTVHPSDDIQKRNLLDVEEGWSYLILLASLARYLRLKELFNVRDKPYHYARDCFLNYIFWISQNERSFLAAPEKLEFPNDTWVAQDIRKSMLLFQGAEYTHDNQLRSFYIERGSDWLERVCQALSKSSQKQFTRILAILMQNYGPHQYTSQVSIKDSSHAKDPTEPALYNEKLTLNWGGLIYRIMQRLIFGVKSFRPGREKDWLRARLER